METEIQKTLLKKAGSLLARRAYSRGELRLILAKLAGDSEVESALNRLEQLNLLNDADYAYNFAFYRTQREGWGPAKIRDSLLRRHLSQATVERALERVRKELGDERILMECIKKRWKHRAPPADPKDIHKLILFLLRRGFDEDAIYRALELMLPTEAIQRFETGD
jgi:SOS response regulatory protein OraA/RecX